MTATAVTPPHRPTALVAGGSGLIGSRLLPLLCGAPDFGRVIAVSRRPLAYDHPKLANRIVSFEQLEQSLAGLHADIAFWCLGSTLAAAGSKETFRHIDLDYAVAFARAALRAGTQRLVLISSLAARASSSNFYLRVKGEIEDEVAKLGFPALDILQPSLIVGWRRELRPLELATMPLLPLLNLVLRGPARKFRAVRAETVARAMLGAARSSRKGLHRHTHEGIVRLADSADRAAPMRGPTPA